MSPFEAALGDRFHLLGSQVRQLHGRRATKWSGQVTVSAAPNPIARMIGKFVSFPPAMDNAPFTLELTQTDAGEQWRRSFDGHDTVSVLRHVDGDILEETFGPVTLHMRPKVKVEQLACDVLGAKLFGKISVPAALVPSSDVAVWQDEAGRYRFDIKGRYPILGGAIRYRGWLLPAEASPLSRA